MSASSVITAELREYIDFLDGQDLIDSDDYYVLVAAANKIDAEHRCRMEQCKRETKRSTARYLRAIIDEYCNHSVKRRQRYAYVSDD